MFVNHIVHRRDHNSVFNEQIFMATIHTNLSNIYKVITLVCHRIHNFSFKRNGLAEVPIYVGVNLIRLHEARLQYKMQLNSNEDLHVLSVFIT